MLHKLWKLLLAFYPAEIELYFKYTSVLCTLNMKYISSILLEILCFPNFLTLKNNLILYVLSILWVHQEFSNSYTSSIVWTCFWNAFTFLFWVRSILEVDFLTLKIYIQSSKCNTWSILFELMHFFQTQKCTWGGLSKFKYLIYSNSEVYFK